MSGITRVSESTNQPKPTLRNRFAVLADAITEKSGSPQAFGMAVILVVIWLVSGPLFFYSDTWQLVINTTTSIITFLMVFLHKTQNRDSRAVHLKLNELLAAVEGASNRLINAEDKGEEVLTDIHRRFQALADVCESSAATRSRSVEEVAQADDLLDPSLSQAELND